MARRVAMKACGLSRSCCGEWRKAHARLLPGNSVVRERGERDESPNAAREKKERKYVFVVGLS